MRPIELIKMFLLRNHEPSNGAWDLSTFCPTMRETSIHARGVLSCSSLLEVHCICSIDEDLNHLRSSQGGSVIATVMA